MYGVTPGGRNVVAIASFSCTRCRAK